MMPHCRLRAHLHRHCCFSTFLQLAETHLRKAGQLLASRKKEDAEIALSSIDTALELCPHWEKALEMKAHTLLMLRRYKDVVEMLHGYVPSLARISPPSPTSISVPESPVSKESTLLLSGYDISKDEASLLLFPITHCFSAAARLRHGLTVSLCNRKFGRPQQWRYLCAGQACFYLGMLEDALVLLQNGKQILSEDLRLRSNSLRDDNFPAGRSHVVGKRHHERTLMDAGKLAQMLASIKFLLQRRSAAMAALDARLYTESVHHFSKIIDARKGSPCHFIADCYLHRAIACQATGRVVEAIADCNRTLALHPNFTKALSVRASLYETVRCYSECLLDLQQLKMVYEAALRYQMLPEPRIWTMRQQLASDVDLAGGLDSVNGKIAAIRQKLSGSCTLDAHTILDMPATCTMDDVKRAYTVLSLKHRPDNATSFIDRCALVDDARNMEMVREEVRASAQRLSQLIHKAYTIVLSCIVEERDREMQGRGRAIMQGTKERQNESPLIEIDNHPPPPKGEGVVKKKALCKTAEVEIHASSIAHDGIRQDETSEIHVQCDKHCSTDDEDDLCDFCQPFGGLTTTALASALSRALLLDSPFADPSVAPTVVRMPDWNIALSLPLKVT